MARIRRRSGSIRRRSRTPRALSPLLLSRHSVSSPPVGSSDDLDPFLADLCLAVAAALPEHERRLQRGRFRLSPPVASEVVIRASAMFWEEVQTSLAHLRDIPALLVELRRLVDRCAAAVRAAPRFSPIFPDTDRASPVPAAPADADLRFHLATDISLFHALLGEVPDADSPTSDAEFLRLIVLSAADPITLFRALAVNPSAARLDFGTHLEIASLLLTSHDNCRQRWSSVRRKLLRWFSSSSVNSDLEVYHE